LLAQEDPRVRTTGELTLIDETTHVVAMTTTSLVTSPLQASTSTPGSAVKTVTAVEPTVPANAVFECDDPNSIYFNRIECKKQRVWSTTPPVVVTTTSARPFK
jgi:hypothetical protein